MAKRSRAAKQASESNERNGEFAPPDRPDQILTGGEQAEEIDIFAKDDQRSAADPGAGDDDHDIPPVREDDEPAPPVESRDKRERDADERPLQRAERSERRGSRDDDDDGYSRRVKRRINREYALRVRAETRLKEERTARQQLEQRLARLERKQIDEQGQASLRDLDAKIKDVAAKLAAAKEANETAREVELQVELAELQGQKTSLAAKLERERIERENATNAKQTDADTDPDDDRPTRKRSAEWIRAQRRWWNTSRWKDARTDAIAHDTTILEEIEEGELDFEPYSDEHLAELSRRLKADYPDLEIRTIEGDVFEERDPDDDDDDDYRSERMRNRRDDDLDDEDDRRPSRQRANGRRRAPMGGLGGREGRRERNEIEMARRGKVILTEDDFAEMRIFKLDPNNAEHKKYFARERARTLLREANNGATRR